MNQPAPTEPGFHRGLVVKLKTQIARVSVSAIALTAAAPLFAQSTGTQEFDQQGIVVTGTHGPQAVNGIAAPDTPKTRQVLTQALITHMTPGQTINDIINLVPGVSFQNNDGYGSSGGFLTIRGFDQSRISETFDGIPLNDTGNYALYSNQQLDSELIDQVNVSLGSTDVDSPTASATGSTINYTTFNADRGFPCPPAGHGRRIQRCCGSSACVDTGDLHPVRHACLGGGQQADLRRRRSTISARSTSSSITPRSTSRSAAGGDFVSLAGHYNKNNNNFFGSSEPLRNDSDDPAIRHGRDRSAPAFAGPGLAASTASPAATDERNAIYGNQLYYKIGACNAARPEGPARRRRRPRCRRPARTMNQAACGSEYDDRFNPSKTANIRVNSRFTLAQTPGADGGPVSTNIPTPMAAAP